MRLTAGGSRVCSSSNLSNLESRGADSPHTSTVGGGSSVNLETPANQIPQPKITEQQKLTDARPVVVEADWEYEEFAWVSEYLYGLPSSYLELMEFLNVDPEKYDLEVDGFYAYEHKRDTQRHCSVERIYVPRVNSGRYHPYTSIKHRRRASSRALDRLEFLEEECRKRHVKFDYLIKIDLTLPKAVSEKWDNKKIQRRIHRAVGDFLKELQDELTDHHSQLGAISNHHYWSTKKPLTPHRHIHLTIPNVAYNKNTGMFHRFQAKIEADLIKKVWKKCLIKNNLWFGVRKNVKPVIWTRYFKFENRGKALHRLSYCSRKPIEDIVKFLKNSDIPDNFDKDFALFLLDYTPRIVNLGFLTNLKRFGYSRKPNFLKCPLCGGDMLLVRNDYNDPILYDRPPPETPFLFQNRAGIWYRVPKGVRGGDFE